jgi:hypothetical protein
MRATWFALSFVYVAGCFPTPSADLACNVTPDCKDGRVCESGFCVVSSVDGGANDDATPGTDAPAFDCTMFKGRHFAGCDIPQPSAPLALSTAGVYTYNTDFASLVEPNGTVLHPADQVIASGRLISIEKLDIGAGVTLRVVGARPLIIASWTTITVNGKIDASSSVANGIGAGANPTECSTHQAANGQNSNTGAGAGGGAGFGGVGGNGGQGDGGNAGAAGAAVAVPLLLGGCHGGTGGTGQLAGGVGGNGGGAVQLTARDSIELTGVITAGGGGGIGATGSGGAGDGGGGGGGSGGMIGLESASVTINAAAIVAANGGGGGGGAEQQTGQNGGDGAASATRATGGVAPNSGDGGPGSGGAITAGAGGVASPDHGGGGGGGGAGFVVISSSTAASVASTIVSPGATLVPR